VSSTTDTNTVLNTAAGSKDVARVEHGAPGAFEHMRSDEIAAALLKVLADHGIIVSAVDDETAMIDVTPESSSQ
jgi:hypothetical protein